MREVREVMRTRDGLRWEHASTVEADAGLFVVSCSCGTSSDNPRLSVALATLDHNDETPLTDRLSA